MSARRISRKRLLAEVEKVTGNNDRCRYEFRLAAMMLGACVVGPNQRKLAKLLGYTKGEVYYMASVLRERGIWSTKTAGSASWFGKDGGIAFNIDLCVALRWMDRAPAGGARAVQS